MNSFCLKGSKKTPKDHDFGGIINLYYQRTHRNHIRWDRIKLKPLFPLSQKITMIKLTLNFVWLFWLIGDNKISYNLSKVVTTMGIYLLKATWVESLSLISLILSAKKSLLSKRNRSLSDPTIYLFIYLFVFRVLFIILFSNLIFMAQSVCSINWGREGPDDSQMVPSPNRANSNASIFIPIAFGDKDVKELFCSSAFSASVGGIWSKCTPSIITSLVMARIAHTPWKG